MVAITVILAAVIATFVLGIGEDVSDPGPTIGKSSGVLENQSGSDGGIVRITHLSGDAVEVSEMEVVVDASDACGETARILNLPSTADDIPGTSSEFDPENLQRGSNSFISEGTVAPEWDIGVLHKDNYNTFEAGEFFEFRITGGDCPLSPGDVVVVDLIHEPTGTLMTTKELQVQTYDS
jgi:FlaG/FlaF family flagellin (archaellin)